MGDSENDLPAWREADVKVLIRHSLNHGLRIPGTIPVKYEDLPNYLEEAARNMTSA
jgi:hypothetical protein